MSSLFDDFNEGTQTGFDIQNIFDRKSRIKRAHTLATEHRYQEAIDLLEHVNLSSYDTSVVNILGYLVKAICHAELEQKSQAKSCLNIILNMSRMSLNPFYHMTLSRAKEEAKKIINEYNI